MPDAGRWVLEQSGGQDGGKENGQAGPIPPALARILLPTRTDTEADTHASAGVELDWDGGPIDMLVACILCSLSASFACGEGGGLPLVWVKGEGQQYRMVYREPDSSPGDSSAGGMLGAEGKSMAPPSSG